MLILTAATIITIALAILGRGASAGDVELHQAFVGPLADLAEELRVPSGANWAANAPCSEDGQGSGFKGVTCDTEGNPIALTVPINTPVYRAYHLPHSITKLTTLSSLSLESMGIRGRLDVFARPLKCLPSIQHLSLKSNFLHGTIPTYIIGGKNITALDLSGNKLTGWIRHLGQLLTSLDLSYNFLSGPLPVQARPITTCNAAHNCFTHMGSCDSAKRKRKSGCGKAVCGKDRRYKNFKFLGLCGRWRACEPRMRFAVAGGTYEELAKKPPGMGWKCGPCPRGTLELRAMCVPCTSPSWGCHKAWNARSSCVS